MLWIDSKESAQNSGSMTCRIEEDFHVMFKWVFCSLHAQSTSTVSPAYITLIQVY